MDQQLSSIAACSECPGFCCKLFFLRMSPDAMLCSYQEMMIEVKALTEQLEDPTEVTIRSLVVKARELDMLHFGSHHFHRVFDVTDESGDSIGDGTGYPKKYAYTCDQWNPDIGRCSCHGTRPWLCESFICAAAAEGRTPTCKDFGFSAQLTEEEVARILCNRSEVNAEVMSE